MSATETTCARCGGIVIHWSRGVLTWPKRQGRDRYRFFPESRHRMPNGLLSAGCPKEAQDAVDSAARRECALTDAERTVEWLEATAHPSYWRNT